MIADLIIALTLGLAIGGKIALLLRFWFRRRGVVALGPRRPVEFVVVSRLVPR